MLLARSAALLRRDLPDALLDLVAPPDCAGRCGRAGEVLCPACAAPLRGPARRVRPHLWPQAPPATTAAAYAGPVRECVAGWKDRGRHDAEPWLGDALAVALAALLDDLGCAARPLLVPVPASRAARRRRGADGVLRLARHAAAALRADAAGGGSRVVPALALSRRVADQAGLGAPQRAANVSGAFRLRRAAAGVVAGRPVVLVDDVLTTGSTLRAAAAPLAAAGAHVVGLACVADTPLRRRLSARSALD